jgi:hypothetical protein
VPLGHTLTFSADGLTAAITARDGIHLVDVTGKRPPSFHPSAPVFDIAPVGNEVWAALSTHRLLRLRSNGVVRGEHPLWGGEGRLRPCAVGAHGALWSEAPPTVIAASGELAQLPLARDADCVVPVSLTRWVVCRRQSVQLRDPGTERWTTTLSGTGRVVDGCVLLEGRTVALLVTAGDALAQLVVLGLHNGTVLHRLTLAGIDLVRFAPARGFALLRANSLKFVVFDLRFGRILAEHTEERAFVDAAIDNAGQSFLLRFSEAHDDIAVGSVRALLAAGHRPPPTLVDPKLAPNEGPDEVNGVSIDGELEPSAGEPIAPAEIDPPAALPGFHRNTASLITPWLLAPRNRQESIAADRVLELLDRYRTLISAMVGHAIARAWDDGRLSPVTEGALPFRAEVAGLLGRASGRAPDEVVDAEALVGLALSATRAAEAAAQGNSPFALQAAEFKLTPIAQLVLLVVVAPSMWGELARLYGILANDDARPLVDELTVVQILAGHASPYQIAQELDREAPLVRHGLVQVGAGGQRPFLSLSCDPIVPRMLRGANVGADLEDIKIIAESRAFDMLLIPAEVKDDIAKRLAEAPDSDAGRIVVRGRSGAGRHALLATLGAAADRWLGVIDASPFLRDLRRRAGELRFALRRAHLLGLLPCVDGLEAIPSDDPGARDTVRQILDDHPGPLAIRLPLDTEVPLSPGYLAIDLPPLSMEQRIEVWQTMLAEHALEVRDPSELADRFSVGPGAIARACAQVAARHAAGELARDADASLALEQAIRQYLASKLRATATRVERLASWSRVILPPDIQESVLELIARIKHRRIVFDRWGMGDIITTARGVTALFSGGPGTGKTLVASAIANELGMDLYRVDLSRIMSKWIGETEQNLAKLFDAAEDGHAIILFDEADSLFSKRTEVKSSVDRYANLEVNYLLQRLDTFEGIAILTTNFGTSIDSAFKRRLSFRLTFPFPDEEARESLWRAHLPAALPRTGEFDLAELARRYRLSGGYIRNATLRAAFLAAEEHVPLSMDHLERAIKAEFREIGKIAESGVLE